MTREPRTVFDEVALQYDAMRPSYPPEVFDIVMSYGDLSSGDPALEIGAGTGKATAGFVERGLRVHALEPGKAMAAILREKGVDVEETTFEDWVLPEHAYRLVFAAQSWHWVQGPDRCPRVADALVPGGVAALFWNTGRPHPEPFKTDNDAIYQRLWPENGGNPTIPWTRASLVEELDASGRFEPVVEHAVTWETSYTSAEWMQMLGTNSNHRMLPDDVRTQLHTEVGAAIDKHGGVLPCVYDTELFLVRRR
jgi:trans-aconitate methyltransferase